MANPQNPGGPQWGQPPGAPGYPAQPGQAQQPGYPAQPQQAQGYPQQGQGYPQQAQPPPGYPPQAQPPSGHPQPGQPAPGPPQQQGYPPQAQPGVPQGQPYAAPAPQPAPMAGAAAPVHDASAGRRSVALPITVAAGLAVGVFAGLLIVKGTGSSDAAKPVGSGAVVKSAGGDTKPGSDTKPGGDTTPTPTIVAKAPIDGGVAINTITPDAAPKVAAAAPPDAAVKAAAPDPKPPIPPPAITTAQLTLEVVGPDEAVKRGVKLKVDGKGLDGTVASITLKRGKKRVKITASAKGYYYSKRVTVTADMSHKVKLWKLRRKKPAGSSASDLIKLGP